MFVGVCLFAALTFMAESCSPPTEHGSLVNLCATGRKGLQILCASHHCRKYMHSKSGTHLFYLSQKHHDAVCVTANPNTPPKPESLIRSFLREELSRGVTAFLKFKAHRSHVF